jgi:protein gp37
MFDKTNKGQWWDFGWKLVEGCTPVSPACKNCWSMAMEKRFRKETGIVFHKERLERPLKRKKPASYAIWNDLFHEFVKTDQIAQVFAIMFLNPQHIFQILTKRPDNALAVFESKRFKESLHSYCNQFHDKYIRPLEQELYFYDEIINMWPLENVWIGVTAENQEMADKRIPILLQIPAKVRFVSCEPLLNDIQLTYVDNSIRYEYLTGWKFDINKPSDFDTANKLNWIIAGPETGPLKRPCKKEWIESLYEQCKSANVPFFDKKDILGKNIQQYPI